MGQPDLWGSGWLVKVYSNTVLKNLMFSSLISTDNGAESSDLTGKILNALGPVVAEHWPKIEPYVDKALAAAQHDETIEMLARNVYPWLPMVVRLAIKEDKFVAFTLEHKGPLLAKLAEFKNKEASSEPQVSEI